MSKRRVGNTVSEVERLFALEYLANGRNASQAWASLHPKAKRSTCSVEGSKCLGKPTVQQFIATQDAARHARLIMEADEALEGITRLARADPRRLFKDNRLLPIEQWPDIEADAVKAIKPGVNGTTLVFYDKLDARKTMAINGGKLRSHVEHEHHFPHLELLGAEPPEGDDE